MQEETNRASQRTIGPEANRNSAHQPNAPSTPPLAKCSVCGASSLHAMFTRTGHDHIGLDGPFSFGKCDDCGAHVLLSSAPAGDLYWLEKTATRADKPEERHYVHWDDDVVRTLASLVPPTKPLVRTKDQKNGRNLFGRARLLDFGSGYGHMLAAATRAGYEAEGLDVSEKLATEARRNSARPVFVGSVFDGNYADERFDIINAHFVLEYVPDVKSVVRELARILAPGGILRICAYTVDSIPAQIKGQNWWNYAPTRRALLSTRTVKYLASASGLDVRTVVAGGEQSFAHYREERGDARFGATTAVDWVRYQAARVRIGRLTLGSRKAFYLQKPVARGS